MDDDLKFLEAELQHLAPAAPPARLERRISVELAVRPAILPWWRVAVLPLAAAAGFAAVLALGNRAPVSPTSNVATEDFRMSPAVPVLTASAGDTAAAAGAQLKPIHVENVLYEQTEEEVITANGASARRERLRYVDTITWQNPRTRASLTWSVPREEVRVVPINYQ